MHFWCMDERFLKWFGRCKEEEVEREKKMKINPEFSIRNSFSRVAQTIAGTSAAAHAVRKTIAFDTYQHSTCNMLLVPYKHFTIRQVSVFLLLLLYLHFRVLLLLHSLLFVTFNIFMGPFNIKNLHMTLRLSFEFINVAVAMRINKISFDTF